MRITHPGYLVYSHDIIMTVLSFYISLYLRLGEVFLDYFSLETLIFGGALFGIISAGVYLYQDLYRGVWRYASLNDLIAITHAVTLVVLIFLLIMFLWTRLDNLPRSYLAINWFVLGGACQTPFRWKKLGVRSSAICQNAFWRDLENGHFFAFFEVEAIYYY